MTSFGLKISMHSLARFDRERGGRGERYRSFPQTFEMGKEPFSFIGITGGIDGVNVKGLAQFCKTVAQFLVADIGDQGPASADLFFPGAGQKIFLIQFQPAGNQFKQILKGHFIFLFDSLFDRLFENALHKITLTQNPLIREGPYCSPAIFRPMASDCASALELRPTALFDPPGYIASIGLPGLPDFLVKALEHQSRSRRWFQGDREDGPEGRCGRSRGSDPIRPDPGPNRLLKD